MTDEGLLKELAEIMLDPKIWVTAIHTRGCPLPKDGKLHGPCKCGGAARANRIERLKVLAAEFLRKDKP